MDQAIRLGDNSICNRVERPDVAGASLGSQIPEGLNAARPDELRTLSEGRGKAGPGGGLALLLSWENPQAGGSQKPVSRGSSDSADRPPGPQRRTEGARSRAARQPPFPLPSEGTYASPVTPPRRAAHLRGERLSPLIGVGARHW